MTVLRVSRLSMSAAGDLIARLWYLLEKHSIASPRVSVEAQAGNFVDINFIFAQKIDADLIRTWLSALAAGPTHTAALRVDMG